MLHWNLTRSIRGQILLLVLTLVLPFGAMLAWFMSAHFQHISDHTHERVRSIADNTTDNLQRYLRQNEAVLSGPAYRQPCAVAAKGTYATTFLCQRFAAGAARISVGALPDPTGAGQYRQSGRDSDLPLPWDVVQEELYRFGL